MKNLFLLSKIAMVVLVSFLAQSTMATVITVKKEGATSMNLYAWGTTPADALGGWPGTPMVSQGNGTFTLDVDDVHLGTGNFIANNSDGQVDLPSPSGGTCFEWVGSVATRCGIEPGQGYTIRIKDKLKWGAMSIYTYSPPLHGGWPGEAMAKYTTDEDGFDWFTFNLPETTINTTAILFNPANDSERATDMLFGAGGYPLEDRCYTIVGVNEYPSEEDCPALPTNQTEILKTKFVVYPNPVVDILTISSEEAINSISIKSINGQTILISTGNTVDLSQLVIGFYLVEVQLADGTIAVQKILKK